MDIIHIVVTLLALIPIGVLGILALIVTCFLLQWFISYVYTHSNHLSSREDPYSYDTEGYAMFSLLVSIIVYAFVIYGAQWSSFWWMWLILCPYMLINLLLTFVIVSNN